MARPPRDAAGRWSILRLHVEDEVPLTRLSQDSGVSARTLSRWHSTYTQYGLAGLEAGSRSDRGSHHIEPELVSLIEGLGLVRPRASIATITRWAGHAADENLWSKASYSVVRSIVSALDPAMATLALDGEPTYRDRYELVYRRQADRPNKMWQADHTLLDILIVDASGEPARPWLTIILDDHSRAACGYYVFLGAPSSMNTALALRQAIWHKAEPTWPVSGIPDILYVDHGTDFTSDQLSIIAAELKFRIIHSQVARPQGRGKVERFFGTLNTELLPQLPGHLSDGQLVGSPTLSLAELDQQIGSFIQDEYQRRKHPELPASPHDEWVGDGWLPRMPESLEELDGLLLTVAKSRQVHRDGIHFQGLRYTASTLAGFVGEAVVIRYDPRDITEIRVFHHDKFLCRAIDLAHVGQEISFKDIQAARNAHRRALRSQINERIAVVAEYLPAQAPRRKPPVKQPRRPESKLLTYREDVE